MKTKKESEYVICTRCKSTVLIAKYETTSQIPMVNLQLNPFNPYSLPPYDPLYLEKDFEYMLVEEKLQAQRDKIRLLAANRNASQYYPRTANFSPIQKYQIYKPLLETIDDISKNIQNLGYISPKKRFLVNRSPELTERSFFNNYQYMTNITSHLPRIQM